jgi:hypothetical protein
MSHQRFWGLVVKAGETKEVTIDEDHFLTVTQAALTKAKSGDSSKIFVHSKLPDGEEKSFLLCVLTEGRMDQWSMEMNFFSDHALKFRVEGSGEIHLIGTLNVSLEEEEEEEEFDEEGFQQLGEEDFENYLRKRAIQIGEEGEEGDEEDEEEGATQPKTEHESEEEEDEEEKEKPHEPFKQPVQEAVKKDAATSKEQQKKKQQLQQEQPQQQAPKKEGKKKEEKKKEEKKGEGKKKDGTVSAPQAKQAKGGQQTGEKLQCSICNKPLKNQQGLAQHMKDKHPENK